MSRFLQHTQYTESQRLTWTNFKLYFGYKIPINEVKVTLSCNIFQFAHPQVKHELLHVNEHDLTRIGCNLNYLTFKWLTMATYR